MYKPTGTSVHIDVKVRDITSFVLNDPLLLTEICVLACKQGGASVQGYYAHQFQPQGVTVVVVLGESHLVMSTYPEHCIFMLDVFTCGTEILPGPIAERVLLVFDGEIINDQEIHRGIAE